MISNLIQRITEEQSEENPYFNKGLLPTFRVNRTFSYIRKDTSIFASASVAFILSEILTHLSEDQKIAVKSIIEAITQNFENYRNKDGLSTYNFWQTKPSLHFPNGYLFHRLKHFKLPDDIDDTSLIYVVNTANNTEVELLREKLKAHVGEDLVYDTWFGESMPKEKDVCALCNLMYLILSSGLPLNSHDIATLKYLNKSIVSGAYLENPFWVSRHYGSVALILYHFARLLYKFEVPQLDEARKWIIESISELITIEKSPINRVLLGICALKLGVKIKRINFDLNTFEDNRFYSFIGAPFAPFNNRVTNWIASKHWAIIGWKCRAHEIALLLEYEVLCQQNEIK
ncbi:MAG: hypothetical protein NXI00_07275 [Cytophagales bacterium]|nr:hypothetical protein [Cytophagales bacterium]